MQCLMHPAALPATAANAVGATAMKTNAVLTARAASARHTPHCGRGSCTANRHASRHPDASGPNGRQRAGRGRRSLVPSVPLAARRAQRRRHGGLGHRHCRLPCCQMRLRRLPLAAAAAAASWMAPACASRGRGAPMRSHRMPPLAREQAWWWTCAPQTACPRVAQCPGRGRGAVRRAAPPLGLYGAHRSSRCPYPDRMSKAEIYRRAAPSAGEPVVAPRPHPRMAPLPGRRSRSERLRSTCARPAREPALKAWQPPGGHPCPLHHVAGALLQAQRGGAPSRGALVAGRAHQAV